MLMLIILVLTKAIQVLFLAKTPIGHKQPDC